MRSDERRRSDRRGLDDPERLARAIATVTGEDEQTVLNRLRQPTPVLVAERLDDETASRLYVAIRQDGGTSRRLRSYARGVTAVITQSLT